MRIDGCLAASESHHRASDRGIPAFAGNNVRRSHLPLPFGEEAGGEEQSKFFPVSIPKILVLILKILVSIPKSTFSITNFVP
jgi:hypothetical protein